MSDSMKVNRPGLLTQSLVTLSRHTLLGRGAARKLMARAVRALNPGRAIDVSLYGGRARLHHTGNNSEMKALLSPKRYARKEYAFCRAHMPTEAGVFVDIGGNAGVISLYVASLMKSGTLICVEPQPKMFERLRTNFSLNPKLAQRLRLELRQTAVGGAEPGRLTLSIPENAGRASARRLEGEPTLSVPVIPMRDLLLDSGVERLDLLKIDVEGYEDGVLYPFFETADPALFPKAIIMEACNSRRWERDCETLLLEHGYKIVHKDRTNMMLVLDRV